MLFNTRILLAGDGWGAVAALSSLLNIPHFCCFAMSGDDDVLELVDVENRVKSFEGEYELIICAGWKTQIPEMLIEKKKILNIHYSLLPKYRGLHSTVWAILNNEENLGLTVHEMNSYFDDGNVIYQYSIPNDFIQTSTWYMSHFNQHISMILGDVLIQYLGGVIRPVKQDKSKASWVGKRSVEDCRIDFNRDLNYQKSFFRALAVPYPLPFFSIKGQKFEVHRCDFIPCDVISHYGRILNIDEEGVWVSCVGGYLIFSDIWETEIAQYVLPNKFRIGNFLD